MGTTSSIVFSGLVPHPPIMVPEVGHEAIAEVRGSIEGMAELSERVIASGAETVVLISPHAPLAVDAFVAYQGPRLHGDFANFRAPETIVEAQLDEELVQGIAQEAEDDKYEVQSVSGHDLDHGTTVPLYFLQHNGWQGRVVALGYSFLSNDDHLRFGACVRRAADKVGRSVAFIASGDLSHRLKPEAPAGYNPVAHLFDEEVVAALQANSPDRIINVDQDLRKLAGECGYRSLLVAFGATEGSPLSCEVLHYEAPFGVGYLVAQLTNAKQSPIALNESEPTAVAGGKKSEPPAEAGGTPSHGAHVEGATKNLDSDELPALARNAVETFVLTGSQIEPSINAAGILGARAACFVSIKTASGDLRGCIGTIDPTRDTLAEELIVNAIHAASRDPRFPPISAGELPGLRYSVDVLCAPEPTTFEQLDAKIYGVIVEDEGASHRGLLLPDLQGVDTASKQVEIAARKAGIKPGSPLKLFRFRVARFRENGDRD